MKSIVIDSYTSWESLPWTQINEKICIIEQKLYNFSKEYDKKNIYKLQNYIINSSDIKIFAIQKISNHLLEYYRNNNEETYIFNDSDKLFIYKSLYSNNQFSKKIEFLVDKVKQYLIYLCLSSEWEARFEPIYQSNLSYGAQCRFQDRLSKFLSNKFKFELISIYNCYLNFKINNKYLDIQYLKHKIQSLPYINYYLLKWFNNQEFNESLNIDLSFNKKININLNDLNSLIYKIIYNGLQWFYLNFIQVNIKSFKILNNLNLYNDNECGLLIHINSPIYIKILSKNLNVIFNSIGLIYNITENLIIKKIENSYYIYNYNIINCQNSKSLLSFKNLYQWVIYINKNVYKKFLLDIKYALYHHNRFKKLRPNNNLNLNKLFFKIKNIITIFYKNYYPIINLDNINSIFTLVNNIIFIWMKKNTKYSLLLDIYQKSLIKDLSYIL